MRAPRTLPIAVALASIGLVAGDDPKSMPVDFDRDVRPILSENCFACHGPDAGKRKAGLRLDTKPGAFADLGGHFALVPGKPGESELIARVTSDDPEAKMPPPNAGARKTLSPGQVDLLRRWVAEGADYKGHWAYERPKKAGPPAVPGVDSPIDRFVRAKLDEKGLAPSAPADRVTLIRRLSFDLLGLPPSPQEVDAFVEDGAPDANERLVDRLLASPHFGERMAVAWLDWVRYGDTAGYHSDNHRDVWLFRDYVIGAFNANKPFDRFTTEQVAGDLLPSPTDEQRVASGYNRMLMTTEEGGAQAREYVAKYAADRVRNASTVWLGATLGCAECHDHKFDPYSTRDFYRFAAFFADIEEVPVGSQPKTPIPTPEQKARIAALDARLAALRASLDAPTPALAAAQADWEKAATRPVGGWTTLRPTSAKSEAGTALAVEADGTVVAGDKAAGTDTYTLTIPSDPRPIRAIRLEVLPDPKLPGMGPGRAANGNFVLNELAASVEGRPVPLANASATFSQPNWDVAGAIDGEPKSGWAVLGQVGKENQAVFETGDDLIVGTNAALSITLSFRYGTQHVLGRFRLSSTDAPRPVRAGGPPGLPGPVRDALAVDPRRRTRVQADAIAAHYRTIAPALEPARREIDRLDKERRAILAKAPATLVATAGMPRVVRILPRGNWLDESGPAVTPAVPGFLGPEVRGRRATRLDLARWMVSADNPLVARVFVNRLWKLAFGQGLVASLEDFGSQGASPSHPELLDWLALTFVEEGWDVKRMLRRILLTESYRRSSRAAEPVLQADPSNLWLARQGRYRLDAEFVRDDMLVVSGLFAPEVGGPSVKPYQPAGYWAHLNFPRRDYASDHGASLYRRALYTYWQRSFLHPSLLAFDAPSREECTATRPRSNTPLQALVLLNDPIFVEGARALAEKALDQGGGDDESRLAFAYRRALSRPPRPAERAILVGLLAKHRDHFRSHPKDAEELTRVGEHRRPEGIETAELAAWTSVARAILNLHETITRN